VVTACSQNLTDPGTVTSSSTASSVDSPATGLVRVADGVLVE
jgi:hypothetical protein